MIHPRRTPSPVQALAGSLAGLTLLGASGALAAEDPQVQKLREQLERQQAIIESQEARLQQQERLLRDLAARIGPAAPAPANLAPAAALARTEAPPAAGADAVAQLALSEPGAETIDDQARPGPVGTRFAGLDVILGGALRTTVTTTTARM